MDKVLFDLHCVKLFLSSPCPTRLRFYTPVFRPFTSPVPHTCCRPSWISTLTKKTSPLLPFSPRFLPTNLNVQHYIETTGPPILPSLAASTQSISNRPRQISTNWKPPLLYHPGPHRTFERLHLRLVRSRPDAPKTCL